jgi:hypothetical protein
MSSLKYDGLKDWTYIVDSNIDHVVTRQGRSEIETVSGVRDLGFMDIPFWSNPGIPEPRFYEPPRRTLKLERTDRGDDATEETTSRGTYTVSSCINISSDSRSCSFLRPRRCIFLCSRSNIRSTHILSTDLPGPSRPSLLKTHKTSYPPHL